MAFLERYLQQTDQKNEDERLSLMNDLAMHYEDEDSFRFPPNELRAEVLGEIIKRAEESAPGPDGIRYSDLRALGEEELISLTAILNASLEDHNIPDDWLDSHLSPVPKPEKYPTS